MALLTPAKGLEMKSFFIFHLVVLVYMFSWYSLPPSAHVTSPEEHERDLIQFPLLLPCPGQPPAISWATLSLGSCGPMVVSATRSCCKKGLFYRPKKLQGGCVVVPHSSCKMVCVFLMAGCWRSVWGWCMSFLHLRKDEQFAKVVELEKHWTPDFTQNGKTIVPLLSLN